MFLQVFYFVLFCFCLLKVPQLILTNNREKVFQANKTKKEKQAYLSLTFDNIDFNQRNVEDQKPLCTHKQCLPEDRSPTPADTPSPNRGHSCQKTKQIAYMNTPFIFSISLIRQHSKHSFPLVTIFQPPKRWRLPAEPVATRHQKSRQATCCFQTICILSVPKTKLSLLPASFLISMHQPTTG